MNMIDQNAGTRCHLSFVIFYCENAFATISPSATYRPQASKNNEFRVILPFESLEKGSTFSFGLRVTTGLDTWGQARIEVFKSADDIPALKVAQNMFKHEKFQLRTLSVSRFTI